MILSTIERWYDSTKKNICYFQFSSVYRVNLYENVFLTFSTLKCWDENLILIISNLGCFVGRCAGFEVKIISEYFVNEAITARIGMKNIG